MRVAGPRTGQGIYGLPNMEKARILVVGMSKYSGWLPERASEEVRKGMRPAFCAAEMAGELFRNLSEKCPLKGLAPVFGVEPSKDVAGLRWSLKKQKTRQAVSLAGFFELSWSSRWCRRGDWALAKQSMW